MGAMKIRNVELTPELQAKLAGCIGMDLKATFKYVPVAWRDSGLPKDIWPVFMLRGKNGLQAAEIEDQMAYVVMKDGEMHQHVTSGRVRVSTLEGGIEAISKLPMSDGSQLWFRNGRDSGKSEQWTIDMNGNESPHTPCSSHDIIAYLSPELQRELVGAIIERATMTEEELQGL